jgi:hypothetical protein
VGNREPLKSHTAIPALIVVVAIENSTVVAAIDDELVCAKAFDDGVA